MLRLRFWVCCHLATQAASAEIVCRHSNFADAARRWEDKESGGAGEFWSSTVLGLEGPMSPEARLCIIAKNCLNKKQEFGDAGWFASIPRAAI